MNISSWYPLLGYPHRPGTEFGELSFLCTYIICSGWVRKWLSSKFSGNGWGYERGKEKSRIKLITHIVCCRLLCAGWTFLIISFILNYFLLQILHIISSIWSFHCLLFWHNPWINFLPDIRTNVNWELKGTSNCRYPSFVFLAYCLCLKEFLWPWKREASFLSGLILFFKHIWPLKKYTTSQNYVRPLENMYDLRQQKNEQFHILRTRFETKIPISEWFWNLQPNLTHCTVLQSSQLAVLCITKWVHFRTLKMRDFKIPASLKGWAIWCFKITWRVIVFQRHVTTGGISCRILLGKSWSRRINCSIFEKCA